jgi:hypothetical protein
MGDDGGTDAPVNNDTGTPTGDSGTEAAVLCDVDAAGSLQIGVDTDAGFVENTACEACIAMNCAQPQCLCLTDTNMATVDDAGEPACGAYAGCVYTEFLTNLAESDAGAAGLGDDLMAAETTCGAASPTPPASSVTLGKGLIGCIATNCATASAGCIQ